MRAACEKIEKGASKIVGTTLVSNDEEKQEWSELERAADLHMTYVRLLDEHDENGLEKMKFNGTSSGKKDREW